jgi:hypothetical protein
MLTIADCRRRIQLEFFLGTVRARRESLRKLDLLLKVLGSFRNALLKEAQAITEYERAGNRRKTKQPQKAPSTPLRNYTVAGTGSGSFLRLFPLHQLEIEHEDRIDHRNE